MTAERDAAAALVNDTIAREPAVPRLVRHAPYDWHLHAIDDDAPLASRIAVETAMAMTIDVVRADEMEPLSVCRRPRRLRRRRRRPHPQPLATLLLHHLRQPGRGWGRRTAPARRCGRRLDLFAPAEARGAPQKEGSGYWFPSRE